MRMLLCIGVIVASCCFTQTAQAGMLAMLLEDIPRFFVLTDTAKLRLDAISFFAVCLLAIAWLIQRVWNSMSKDFPRLPRISYLRALGLMALWGFLFLLVLTMISGARELMTPGAWKKTGLTYKLQNPPLDQPSNAGATVARTQENC